jgi:putative ABC transport system permease protein
VLDFLLSILEQGLIYAPIVLGVYITYSILDFPDLSVDGTFPLGAAVTAVCIVSGIHPILAILISVAAGAAAGFVTGALHVYLKITNLLCGILVMTALYSVNLRIMEKSNIPLLTSDTIFTTAIPKVAVVLIVVILIKLLLDAYMNTYAGKSLLAVGVNEQLVKTLSINTGRVKIIGLMIANGLAALSGSLMAQYQRFADIGMGSGTVVIGLAAVIIGLAVFGKARFIQGSTAVIFGSIIYKLSIGVALQLGLKTTDMKLITAVFFVIVIVLQKEAWRKKIMQIFRGPKGGHHA